MFHFTLSLQGFTQPEDIPCSDEQRSNGIVAAFARLDLILELCLGTRTEVGHRLKTVRTYQRNRQGLAQFKPQERQPAFVFQGQADADLFSEEGMIIKMALGTQALQSPVVPPRPACQRPDDQI